jgi:predicted DNA binding CopG/RHH family protein
MKTKKNKAIDPENPPLTEAQLQKFRPLSSKRREMFRQAYLKTFKKEPPVMGRPPKDAAEKYRHVHIRLHPQALAWAKQEAERRGIGYQTVINETLLHRAA